MSQEAHLQGILQKALAGQASEEELRWLVEELKRDENFEMTEQVVALLASQSAGHTIPGEERANSMVDAILNADKLTDAPPLPVQQPKAAVLTLWKKVAVAAAIVAVAIAAFYLWSTNKQTGTELTDNNPNQQQDVDPGHNKARLILADGTVVGLDTLANGALKVQGQTRIAKQKDGQLAYETTPDNKSSNNITANPLYNTVVVPRGGQYKLILTDGTQVWLNAASYLRFPVEFTGEQRIVELEGEGYFEVAKDAARPFIVRTRPADVRVLGTHFNVCAYPQEDWKTTLLEGKVRVDAVATNPVNNKESQLAGAILAPGQQAVIAMQPSISSQSIKSPKIQVQICDIDEAIAWKEGYFHFSDASVKNIMQQVSRWYDVDIVYKDTAAGSAQFNGRINRTIKLSGIVNALKQGGINCTIDQRRLLVNP
ncbi:MAG: FecR domain-containing protein [Niastella sp.]|nr:FecR domain-containing protein [Niastella sp.]